MMVWTAPPAIGLAIMLLWSGSLTTPSAVSASLIGDTPVEDDRDRVSDTISRYKIIVLRIIVLRNWRIRNFFSEIAARASSCPLCFLRHSWSVRLCGLALST
jgi:hypothetical protein